MPKEFDAFTRLDASDVNTFLVNNGELRQILYFTSGGTFTKATYPWLNAIRVRCQAGGGGGAGCATTSAGQYNGGRSGAAGAYAESFITNIAGLAASVTVTVGSGGSGGAAAGAGSAGGQSSFGSLVSANGGGGGFLDGPGNMPGISPSIGGPGGFVGGLGIPGGASSMGVYTSGFAQVGDGGRATLSGTIKGIDAFGAAGFNGSVGAAFGGGGTGGFNTGSQATARSGGAGAGGIVILELFA
jgi:hypothetical protein